MTKYPMISFLTRYGRSCAIVLGLFAPLIGIYLVAVGLTWLLFPVSLVVGAVVYAIAESYIELIEVISETLLPQ